MDVRTQVAPKGLHFRASDFVISDKYATILTVVSYPKFIGPGNLSSLTISSLGVGMIFSFIKTSFLPHEKRSITIINNVNIFFIKNFLCKSKKNVN